MDEEDRRETFRAATALTSLPGSNYGEYRIESLPGCTGDILRSPTQRFVYAPGNIMPTWCNLQDVEIVGITRWLDNRLPIESVRAETHTVTLAHTEWQPPPDYASSLQVGIEVPGALLFNYAERCAVTGGGIEHIGNDGIGNWGANV